MVLEPVFVELGDGRRRRQVLLRREAVPGLDRDAPPREVEHGGSPALRLGNADVVVLDRDSGGGLDKRRRDVELARRQLDARRLDLDQRRLDVEQLGVGERARGRDLDEARRDVDEARRRRRAREPDVDEARPDVDQVGRGRRALEREVDRLGPVAEPCVVGGRLGGASGEVGPVGVERVADRDVVGERGGDVGLIVF